MACGNMKHKQVHHLMVVFNYTEYKEKINLVSPVAIVLANNWMGKCI